MTASVKMDEAALGRSKKIISIILLEYNSITVLPETCVPPAFFILFFSLTREHGTWGAWGFHVGSGFSQSSVLDWLF